MNKICKRYISEVKTFFPIIGKAERDYIAKLRANVDNFCDEVDISTKEDLYKQYGMPIDVVHDYYSSIETESIIKRIFLVKYIKRAVVLLMVLSTLVTITYCTIFYHDHKIVSDEEAVFIEQTIE